MTVNLPSHVSAELEKHFSNIRGSPYSKKTQLQFLDAAKEICNLVLPEDIKLQLRRIRDPFHRGMMIIHGIPVDQSLCPTPTDGLEPQAMDNARFIGEAAHLGLAAMINEVYTLEIEKGHRLVQTVAPRIDKIDFKGSVGSAANFDFHQEDRASPYCPEHIILSCLREDIKREATTVMTGFWDIVPYLVQPEHAETLAVLQDPTAFAIQLPMLFRQTGTTAFSNEVKGPALFFDGSRPILCTNFNDMKGLTPRAVQALSTLHKWFTEAQSSIKMRPGDVVILNNSQVVHTRTGTFEVRGDGTDRWLMRSFIHRQPSKRIIPRDSLPENSVECFIAALNGEMPTARL